MFTKVSSRLPRIFDSASNSRHDDDFPLSLNDIMTGSGWLLYPFASLQSLIEKGIGLRGRVEEGNNGYVLITPR